MRGAIWNTGTMKIYTEVGMHHMKRTIKAADEWSHVEKSTKNFKDRESGVQGYMEENRQKRMEDICKIDDQGSR